MSRAIIFCGLPGGGKTTLSREVAKRLNITSLHKDVFKETLYELMSGKTLDDSKLTGRYAVELLLTVAENVTRNNVDIIIESPFNHVDNAKRFQEWKNSGTEIFIVVCTVDDQERIRRTEIRERHPAHHQMIRPAGAIDYSGVDYGSMPDPKLFIDTSQSLDLAIDQVLEFLGRK